ncbi:MAG: 5-formyltetrahydrofolate cyclo-ligase [Betaproteobacteria bacterium]|nr:5-formyltetrahydrofolate cyclo-ligase [Betaproteobacteria bacterium]
MSLPSDKKRLVEAIDLEQDVKPALRRSLLTMRCALDEIERARWNRKIIEHLERYLQTHSFSTLGIYFSTQNEPDLIELYAALSRKGLTLSLPVVMGKTLPLQFVKWKPGDPLVKDNFGISIPEIKEFVPLPQTLLVPCLGFTRNRFRLGYGGGYFDRTLEQQPRPHTIGIAYACLEVQFPVQEHDIAMDCIITETGAI